MKTKKLKAIKELLKGFWFIFIKGRHPAQFNIGMVNGGNLYTGIK